MALVLSLALLTAAATFNVAVQRILLDRQSRALSQWADLQARVLSQSAAMRALALLADPRAVDDNCRPVGSSGSGQNAPGTGPQDVPGRSPSDTASRGSGMGGTLDQRVSTRGGQLACEVQLQGPLGAQAWACRCDATAPGTQTTGQGAQGQAQVQVTFSPTSAGLHLRARSQVSVDGQGPAVVREEFMVLQRDGRGIWRAQIGSWTDRPS